MGSLIDLDKSLLATRICHIFLPLHLPVSVLLSSMAIPELILRLTETLKVSEIHAYYSEERSQAGFDFCLLLWVTWICGKLFQRGNTRAFYKHSISINAFNEV